MRESVNELRTRRPGKRTLAHLYGLSFKVWLTPT
jgi:hypothetical protein